MGDQAVGFACYEDRPDTGYTSSLRMTPAIAPLAGTSGGASSAFVRPFALGGTLKLDDTGKGYFERIDGACGLDIESFRKPAEWIIINAPLKSLNFADGVNTMTVEVNGKLIGISEQKDLQLLPGYWQVPLTGSSSAIGKLIRSCPRIQAELDAGCGSGD